MIKYDSYQKFQKSLKTRDINHILETVKILLNAISKNRKSVALFSAPDETENEIVTYHLNKDEYEGYLNKVLPDLEKHEYYEICAEITKNLNQLKNHGKDVS